MQVWGMPILYRLESDDDFVHQNYKQASYHREFIMRKLITFGFFLVTLYVPLILSASPWTLPENKMALSLFYDYQFADQEYLENAEAQNFPLNGQFAANTLRFDIRYGVSDRLELSLGMSFKDITYSADPAIIEFPEGAEFASLPVARGEILNFNRKASGISDIFPALRYNISKGIILVTSETKVKLPSGYKQPSSTLNEKGVIVDDVTLGDGQIDIEESILFGSFINASKTFFRVDMGGRLRFGEPGHQLFGGIKIGQFIGSRFVVTASVDGAITVVEGDPIGTSFVASSGNLTAQNVTTEQIIPKPLFLDKDLLSLGLGALFVIQEGVEVQLSANQFIGGRNIPVITTFTFGSSFSFNLQ